MLSLPLPCTHTTCADCRISSFPSLSLSHSSNPTAHLQQYTIDSGTSRSTMTRMTTKRHLTSKSNSSAHHLLAKRKHCTCLALSPSTTKHRHQNSTASQSKQYRYQRQAHRHDQQPPSALTPIVITQPAQNHVIVPNPVIQVRFTNWISTKHLQHNSTTATIMTLK